MARLRRIMQSALEDRSVRFLLATIALGVAVSLVAGFAIGYRVEESHIKPAKKVAAAVLGTGAAARALSTKLTAAPDLIGAAYAPVKKDVLIVVTGPKKVVRLSLGEKTRIALAKPASASDIKVGSKVLFQPSSSNPTTATEVVVLPAAALIGAAVTAVVPGTSMTLKSLRGAGLVIKTSGAPVLKTGPGAVPDIAAKDRVVVRYFRVGVGAKRRAAVVEIVVLPSTSKFR
ncbi:MAG: hypothetical protein ACLPVY_17650 [Acidimicrobiia bacterium]